MELGSESSELLCGIVRPQIRRVVSARVTNVRARLRDMEGRYSLDINDIVNFLIASRDISRPTFPQLETPGT